jgi:flagellar transcriptional activator FlhC
VLSLTRAWTLVRFFESKMLTTTGCCKCRGHFVVHRLDLHQDYLCGLCHMPSRAGKTKKAKDAVTAVLESLAMPMPVSAPMAAALA